MKHVADRDAPPHAAGADEIFFEISVCNRRVKGYDLESPPE
jgi:hypothetical protein